MISIYTSNTKFNPAGLLALKYKYFAPFYYTKLAYFEVINSYIITLIMKDASSENLHPIRTDLLQELSTDLHVL